MTMLDSFDALLQAAHEQPEGQRFLLVFCRKELPSGSNDAQARRFESGLGGALVPVLFADKGEAEIADFPGLVAEAEQSGSILGKDDMSAHWDMLVVGCLGGYGAREPTSKEAEKPLNELVQMIRAGNSLMHLAAFDRQGNPVRFQ